MVSVGRKAKRSLPTETGAAGARSEAPWPCPVPKGHARPLAPGESLRSPQGRGQEVRSGTLGWGEVGLCGTGPGRSTRMVRGRERPLRPGGVDTGRECARPITTALSRGRWRGRPRAGRPPGPRPSGSGPTLLWAGSQPAGPLAVSPGWSSCVDRRGEAGRGSQRREGVVGVQSLVTGRRRGGA